MSDVAPWREVPEGKQVNGFTGELEDKAPLSLNPDPAEQRILSNNPVDKPLAELNQLFVEGKIQLNGKPTQEELEVNEEQMEEATREEKEDDIPVQTSDDARDTKGSSETSTE